jgi:hypothetical protein
MTSHQNANQISGRAIGALFFTAFGALWLMLSLYARETLSVATVTGVLLGVVALAWNAIYLLRAARRLPRAADDPRVGRIFAWVNGIQWIACFVAAFALGKLHLDAYVPSAITCVVGLHFFPLAWLFRYPLHHVTGAMLVAWSGLSALAVPAAELQGITSAGTGLILWLSALATLGMALYLVRKPVRQLA